MEALRGHQVQFDGNVEILDFLHTNEFYILGLTMTMFVASNDIFSIMLM